MCGSLVGMSCVCGTKTFSCSASGRTTATLVSTNRKSNLLPCGPDRCFIYANSFMLSLCFASLGITALIELPKNCVAAAMDKEIGKRHFLMISTANNQR